MQYFVEMILKTVTFLALREKHQSKVLMMPVNKTGDKLNPRVINATAHYTTFGCTRMFYTCGFITDPKSVRRFTPLSVLVWGPMCCDTVKFS